MTRLYDNKYFALRLNISIVVLTLVVVYGVWELWAAFFVPAAQPDTTGALFGLFFVGGGLWGFKQTWTDHRDRLAAFDADLAAGRGVVVLWRPFRMLRIEAPLEQFTAWRFLVKTGARNVRTYYFLFRAPGYPNELQMEVRRGENLPEALRKLAPQAVADFEENTGAGAAAEPPP